MGHLRSGATTARRSASLTRRSAPPPRAARRRARRRRPSCTPVRSRAASTAWRASPSARGTAGSRARGPLSAPGGLSGKAGLRRLACHPQAGGQDADRLGHVPPGEWSLLRRQTVYRLIRMKGLDSGRLLGHFLVGIDGTGPPGRFPCAPIQTRPTTSHSTAHQTSRIVIDASAISRLTQRETGLILQVKIGYIVERRAEDTRHSEPRTWPCISEPSVRREERRRR